MDGAELLQRLDRTLRKLLERHALPIYMLSLDGLVDARTVGSWCLQIHFESDDASGGVLHCTIGAGEGLDHVLADALRGWLDEAALQYPAKHLPRVLMQIAC